MTRQVNNDFAWFPLYARDFVANPRVQVLDNERLGAYFRLLCAQWLSSGSLPSDDSKLAILSCSYDRWPDIKGDVLAFFGRTEDNGYANERLVRIRKEQEEKHRERVKSGRRGGRAAAKKRKASSASSSATGSASSNQKQKQKQSENKRQNDPSPHRPASSGANGDGLVRRIKKAADDGMISPEEYASVTHVIYAVTLNKSSTEKQRRLGMIDRYKIQQIVEAAQRYSTAESSEKGLSNPYGFFMTVLKEIKEREQSDFDA